MQEDGQEFLNFNEQVKKKFVWLKNKNFPFTLKRKLKEKLRKVLRKILITQKLLKKLHQLYILFFRLKKEFRTRPLTKTGWLKNKRSTKCKRYFVILFP
jgi:hypothetical protein